MRALLEGGRLRLGQGDIIEGEGTIQDLAQSLRIAAMRGVVDKTGLAGSYRVKVVGRFVRREPVPDDQQPSIFTAVQEQLGLKLVSSRAETRALVIDHIERPTEN
jgi:uncharacterized protein (TIGR03435 family)